MYDGVVYVAQNDRGGVFLMFTVPARPFPRRTPRPDGLATIVDGKLIRRENAPDARARRVELLLEPTFQLSQKLQLALP